MGCACARWVVVSACVKMCAYAMYVSCALCVCVCVCVFCTFCEILGGGGGVEYFLKWLAYEAVLFVFCIIPVIYFITF